MNCGNFETIITELARNQIVEVHLREAGLEHPRYCSVCANRFANEIALTAGLRALASEVAASVPSSNVETALLEAFRSQAADVSSSVAKDVSVVEMPARNWSRFALAAAAIIVIALTSIIVIVIRAQRNHLPGTTDRSANNQNPKPVPQKESSQPKPDSTVREDGNQSKGLAVNRNRNDRMPVVPHRFRNRRGGNTSIPSEPDPTAGFISLTIAGEYMPLESGQIIKVEMPRAALLAIGLPMNAQRAGESIKAELLVGQDGIARAIRFLQ